MAASCVGPERVEPSCPRLTEFNMSLPQTSRSSQSPPPGAGANENRLIWVIWWTYGAFYFCRNNLSVALPGIEQDLGYDKQTMGMVLMALKVTYGLGQLVNGQLAERLSPKRMLAVGMVATAALNVVFGFGTALYFFVFVWALNGYSQSLGWTPCVRVIGNWIPVARRGWAVGIVGTGYQLTGALTYVVAGAAVYLFEWRGALFVPPVILVTSAVVMWVRLHERPRSADIPTPLEDSPEAREPTTGVFANLRLTISNPALWILGLSLGMLNACRYGYLDWGVSHLQDIERNRVVVRQIDEALPGMGAAAADRLRQLRDADLAAQATKRQLEQAIEDGLFATVQRRLLSESLLAENTLSEADRAELEDLRQLDLGEPDVQRRLADAVTRGTVSGIGKTAGTSILKSAIRYALLPFGAIFGSFLAGWATDRFFASRRAPVMCLLLIGLGLLTLVYDFVARSSFAGTMVLLLLVGFCVYGPQVLLVGTAPADLAKRGTSAAAAGFVNAMGYAGAAVLGDQLTGYLVDSYGWQVAIWVLAGWAFGAAILTAVLWNSAAVAEGSPAMGGTGD